MHFNLHGLVSVVLVDPTGPGADLFREEYGKFLSDIDSDAPCQSVIYVSNLGKGFSKRSGFCVKEPIWVIGNEVVLRDFEGRVCKLNFDSLSPASCHLEFDHEFNPSFFVIAIEYALAQFFQLYDKVFVHSSGFSIKGKSVLVPAWRHTGKTNLLLAALRSGASYIADDWSLLGADGQALVIPKRLNLLYYNLGALPSNRLVSDEIRGVQRFLESNSGASVGLSETSKSELRGAVRMRLSADEVFPRTGESSEAPMIGCIANLVRSSASGGQSGWDRRDANYGPILASTLWFEHHNFFVAYEAHKGLGGTPVELLEESPALAKSITSRALSQVPMHLQAVIGSQQNVGELASQLISMLAEGE